MIVEFRGFAGRIRHVEMNEVTEILNALSHGDSASADELMPMVYEELRRLAASRMAGEAPGQTLQATALVHEAWMRLSDGNDQQWDGRGHFFAAAAEAMRRILVENARRKKALKRGGDVEHTEFDELDIVGVNAVPIVRHRADEKCGSWLILGFISKLGQWLSPRTPTGPVGTGA